MARANSRLGNLAGHILAAFVAIVFQRSVQGYAVLRAKDAIFRQRVFRLYGDVVAARMPTQFKSREGPALSMLDRSDKVFADGFDKRPFPAQSL